MGALGGTQRDDGNIIVDFLLDTDLENFRGVLRKFFEGEVTSAFIRSRLLESSSEDNSFSDDDQALWNKLAELGPLMAPVAEEYDGLGFGSLASQVVIEESARVLLPLPLFETIAFGLTPISYFATAEKKKEILPEIITGGLRLSGCFTKEAFEAPISATKKGEGYQLSGSVDLISLLGRSEKFLVPALIDKKGLALFLVSVDEKGLSEAKLPTLDLVRPYSSLKLKNVSAELLSEEGVSESDISSFRNHLSLLAAAELVGLGDKILLMTIDYVQTRNQFGKPIGSFQAVQHKLSDMHMKLEQAMTLSRFAAKCADEDKLQFQTVSPAAKAFASEVIPQIIEDALQVHGGIGFTYEFDLHFYLRRAKVMSALFGGVGEGYQRVGNLSLA